MTNFKVSNTPEKGLDRTAEHPARDSADRKDRST